MQDLVTFLHAVGGEILEAEVAAHRRDGFSSSDVLLEQGPRAVEQGPRAVEPWQHMMFKESKSHMRFNAWR